MGERPRRQRRQMKTGLTFDDDGRAGHRSAVAVGRDAVVRAGVLREHLHDVQLDVAGVAAVRRPEVGVVLDALPVVVPRDVGHRARHDAARQPHLVTVHHLRGDQLGEEARRRAAVEAQPHLLAVQRRRPDVRHAPLHCERLEVSLRRLQRRPSAQVDGDRLRVAALLRDGDVHLLAVRRRRLRLAHQLHAVRLHVEPHAARHRLLAHAQLGALRPRRHLRRQRGQRREPGVVVDRDRLREAARLAHVRRSLRLHHFDRLAPRRLLVRLVVGRR